MRLGGKYDIPQLRSRGLARINFEAPTELEIFLQSPADWTQIRTPHGPNLWADVLQLAMQCHIRTALPLAFYSCAKMNVERLFSTNLARETLVLILKGKEKIMAQQWAYYMGWVEEHLRPRDCSTSDACTQGKLMIVANLHKERMHEVVGFKEWDEMGWDVELCSACMSKGQKHYEAQMEKLWEALPSFFDLPKWDILVNEMET